MACFIPLYDWHRDKLSVHDRLRMKNAKRKRSFCSVKEFDFVKSLIPFTAFDESGIVGFFTLRNPGKSVNELRFGFVIVDPQKRGKGYGKAMIRQGLKFAFQIYGARRVSLGVFENNPSAYHCYKAVGFQDMISNHVETYCVMNEEWKCLELSMEP